jgi:hypothetical protein
MKRRPARPSGRIAVSVNGIAVAVVLLCALQSPPAGAESDLALRREQDIRPDGIHVLDGSYVLNAGELHINITNHGLIGSQYTQTFPFSGAPSGQWPGGSGSEYLWGAGLWIGASVNGQLSVTTGQPERELRPGDDLRDTIYEARDGMVARPERNTRVTGARLPEPDADDDRDGRLDEDLLNGRDDDGDGLIDEDFGQLASQMMTCTMHDNIGLVRELYPDHLPLGITVVQHAAAFAENEFEDIVIFDFEIANTGLKPVKDVYLGMYVDCDIQRRGHGGSAPDDLAGFYRGAVRGSDGLFHRLEVGWMKDGAVVDPLPGVFGTIVLGHTTDPLRWYAPNLVGVNSFQIFATNARDIQDGEPFIDSERYTQMSRRQIDRDRRSDQPGDLKYMMASGPFANLPPGRRLSYQVAMVVGDGMADMLRNALAVSEVHRGRDFDLDNSDFSGTGGRETMLCVGDYPTYENGEDRLFSYRYVFMDNGCIGTDPVFGAELIGKNHLFAADYDRRCVWVNADNCEECFRVMGQECTVDNQLYWLSQSSDYRTGVDGREYHVPWVFPGEYPPAAPNVRVEAGDNAVEIFWDDISEYDADPGTGQRDFESYRIWRVANWLRPEGTSDQTGPEARLWALIDEYDVVNTVAAGIGGSANERSLGRNTGLEPARYVPPCLSDPHFTGLAAAIQTLVDSDVQNRILVRPPLRDTHGAVFPGLEALVPWEYAPTVLDTFFAVASRPAAPLPDRVVAKRGVTYYHHRDTEVHNGFQTYYSVVASDHLLVKRSGVWLPAGPGVQGDPGNNQYYVTPAPQAQTADRRAAEGVNIYAYPNPATRASLAEFQKQPASQGNPTGEHIMFNNLPAARNTVKIFTANGELVATVPHDGTDGNGAASWNLISRNGQEIVSGIYLYVVESDDSRFAPFRGRFVVVR